MTATEHVKAIERSFAEATEDERVQLAAQIADLSNRMLIVLCRPLSPSPQCSTT